MSYKGIDIRSGTNIIFRRSVKDANGAVVATGTTTLMIVEVQSDGSYKTYDFNDNTFKATSCTTPTVNMTHRTANAGAVNTGIWNYVLATVSGFTTSNIYKSLISNSLASSPQQEREFQWGGNQEDISTLALDSTVAKDATVSKPGTAQTITAPADIATIKADLETAVTGLIAVAAAIKAKTDGLTYTVTGKPDVTVSGYATGQAPLQPLTAGRTLDVDTNHKAPATLAAADVTNNLPVDLKAITAGVDLSDTMKASVNAEVDSAFNTAIPGSPTADSINERIKTMDTADIPGRLPDALDGGFMKSQVKGQDNIDFGALQKASITTAVPTVIAIREEMDSNSTQLAAIVEADTQIFSRVTNLGGNQRVLTSLTDFTQAASGDNWVEIEVFITDADGAKFDPADITPTGTPRLYNGVGAEFENQIGGNVVMYADMNGTPLTTVANCHHTSQACKPQIIPRVSTGYYRCYANATATGNKLPLGQFRMNVGFFDITQAAATYGSTHITDTTPTSHVEMPFSVLVQEAFGYQELSDQITALEVTAGSILNEVTDSMDTFGAALVEVASAEQTILSNGQSILTAMEAPGGMTGIHTATVQFYITDTTTPMADVSFDVWNSTETLKMNNGSLLSNSVGIATFKRDNGVYKIHAIKAGTTIATGTVTVNDNNPTQIIYGSAIAYPATTPGMQTLIGNVRKDLGWAVATGSITATIAEGKQIVGGSLMQTNSITAVIDGSGNFALTIPISCRIKLEVPKCGTVTIPINSTTGIVDIGVAYSDYIK